ncbi:hypothetical protein SAICODRAFT_22718 [Saitoella complicata NRRL Y-17804]|nr:uncharacterized protein SAICODRAFT_22718 [Saitoella complicata NRRL Y-17804]ODQ56340.1 hypothetical protein SAICODRAFT_22718 [Saitoella complicata NRRL Y-17804]
MSQSVDYFEYAPAALIVLDSQRIVRQINEKARELLVLTNACVNNPYNELHLVNDYKRLDEVLDHVTKLKLSSSESGRLEVTVAVGKKGSDLVHSVDISAYYDTKGGVMFTFAIDNFPLQLKPFFTDKQVDLLSSEPVAQQISQPRKGRPAEIDQFITSLPQPTNRSDEEATEPPVPPPPNNTASHDDREAMDALSAAAVDSNPDVLLEMVNSLHVSKVINSFPGINYVFSRLGVPFYYSASWYELTGIEPGDLNPQTIAGTLHPDDVELWAYTFMDLLKNPTKRVAHKCRVRSKNGTYRWYINRANPVLRTPPSRPDGEAEVIWYSANLTDIHDLVEAQEEAAQAQSRLKSVIDYSGMTYYVVDRNLNLQYFAGPESHGSFIHLIRDALGGEGPFLGQSLAMPIIDPVAIHCIRRVLEGESEFETHDLHLSADRDNRVWRRHHRPIMGDDKKSVVACVGCVFDVTNEIRKDRELAKANEERARLAEEQLALKASETAARESSRMKSEFLANMSHEIRTPIAAVIGMTEMLSDSKLDEEQQQLCDNVRTAASSLLSVINDILDVSKIEAGKLAIENMDFDLCEIFNDIKKIFVYPAARKDISFSVNCQTGSCPVWVLGDKNRIGQILTNLLSNALKFTPAQGTVTLTATRQERPGAIAVTFAVTDTGIGMSKDTVKKLFQPFSQADSSTARKWGGSGLGLSICKKLTELMNGTINVTSEPGKGSTVKVCIPFVKSQREPGEENAKGDEHSGKLASTAKNYQLKRPRDDYAILIAEDNLINQRIAVSRLKKMGFGAKCVAVDNGKKALDALRARIQEDDGESKPFDLFLCDCHMPEMDGYEATSLLRQDENEAIRNVPVIAMTASAIRGDREKCIAVGMSDYVSKPVNVREFEEVVLKWLSKMEGDK